MNRSDDPRWREACRRVDDAASLLETTRRSTRPEVWDARDGWADAARGWLEGAGTIEVVTRAADRFVSTAEAAASTVS